jgi:hypothetical protein
MGVVDLHQTSEFGLSGFIAHLRHQRNDKPLHIEDNEKHS